MKIWKEIMPPILFNYLKSLSVPDYGWSGDFKDWQSAKNHSDGYDSEEILLKVKEALLKVKNGQAAYERDSCLFNKIQYSFLLLSSILWIAMKNQGNLNIVDFGGSLGSTYFQNKKFLDDLVSCSWNIIEQDKFCQVGKEYFTDQHLNFYRSLEECCDSTHANSILFSSSLQYISQPYNLLEEIIQKKFDYIIFDRTYFLLNDQNKDRLTIQKVPPDIYKASYPCWFFSLRRFYDFFEKNGYSLIYDFKTSLSSGLKLYHPFEEAEDLGFLFARK